ncbi:unnamed protein product, partial [Citrullus colocynthis]
SMVCEKLGELGKVTSWEKLGIRAQGFGSGKKLLEHEEGEGESSHPAMTSAREAQ